MTEEIRKIGHCVHAKTAMADIMRFREMMGDKRNSIDKLQDWFSSLLATVLFATGTRVHPDSTPEEITRCQQMMECLEVEWPKRAGLMVTQPLHKAIQELRRLTGG